MPAVGQQQSVTTILDCLKQDLESETLRTTEREGLLSQLKVLGRDVTNLGAGFLDYGINTLGAYAFGDYPQTTSREALRCIANALLLIAKLRETFVAIGLHAKAAKAYANPNDDDEFLLSRILFLLTYEPNMNFELLGDDLNLVDNINAHLARHAERQSFGKSTLAGDQMNDMALCETLKLLFNIANADKQQSSRFSPAVPHLLVLLRKFPTKKPPLQPPLTYILNALAAVDFDTEEERRHPSGMPKSMKITDLEIRKAIVILEHSVSSYSPAQLETQAIPLLTVLRKMNYTEDTETRKLMRDKLLPKDSERDVPLGKSSSLASQLLTLTTSPGLINLPEAISSLLFEISESDASEYVKNVGYGFAAGYLMAHKIPVPDSVSQSHQQGSNNNQIPINPVTGQRLDKEPSISGPPMTTEEKEREAERLFVLFERLRATGVVDVKNPVQQAMEEGRFEELSDSDS